MKFIICLAVLSATINAEELKISKIDAKKIFQESLVEAKDMQKYVDQLAGMIPRIQPTSLSKDELIQAFNNDYVEREDAYLELVQAEIQPKDLENVIQLLNHPLYLEYRDTLALINQKCIMQAFDKTKEVASMHPQLPVSLDVIHEVRELDKEKFDQVLATSKYVIIDVYADWCGPCKMIAPIIQALSNQYGDKYTFTKLNYNEENQALGQMLSVKMLPTLILYKEGKEVTRATGFMDKAALIALFESTFTE